MFRLAIIGACVVVLGFGILIKNTTMMLVGVTGALTSIILVPVDVPH